MKNTFLIFVIFILTKWCLLYAFQFYGKWQVPDFEGLIFAIIVLLVLPVLEILILWWPIHFMLKRRNALQALYATTFFAVEFLLTWLMTSQTIEIWMFVKMSLSVVLFAFFYRKQFYCLAF